MEFDLTRPWKSLDEWQKEVISTEGNIIVKSPRQVGKSTAISILAGKYAVENKNQTILIIASVERQAYWIFEKVLNYLQAVHPKTIPKSKKYQTKTKLELLNGTKIYCLPTGQTGHSIRGLTCNMLIADEAAYIPQAVWAAVTPMLAVTKGRVVLLSTPNIKDGHFYKIWSDEKNDYKKFSIKPEDNPRLDKQAMEAAKRQLTKAEFVREWLGEFVDDLLRVFSDEIIQKATDVKVAERGTPKAYLGVDVGGMGKDISAYEIVRKYENDYFIHIQHLSTSKTYTTDVVKRIIELDSVNKFRKIYVDSGGIGFGVYSQLRLEKVKWKVEELNNASRALDLDERRKKKILKEELYHNLVSLMEQGKFKLLDNDEVRVSLASCHYDISEKGRVLITGTNTHIAEALIRAAWGRQEKSLNLWAE